MDYSSRLKSKMNYVYDSVEEQEEEEDMLLACILVSESGGAPRPLCMMIHSRMWPPAIMELSKSTKAAKLNW